MNNPLLDFAFKIVAIDSTTGKEGKLADYLVKNFAPTGAKIELQKVTKNQKNLFFKWGEPKIIFCTHLDTVPPYITPHKKNGRIYGRGAIDAKGQITVMYETCRKLYQEHQNNFGLLLLADEEKRSRGAKVADKSLSGCQYIIVGEPTENKLIKAAKGVALIKATISGKARHSGYPKHGACAVEKLRQFLNLLARAKFPQDKLLGKTTYNISQLKAPNPDNVIPARVTFNVLLRTTFASHDSILNHLKRLAPKNTELRLTHASPPMEFFTISGIKTGVVAFGSDASHLKQPEKRLLYGPGNILNAHTENEWIAIADLKTSVRQLKKLYYKLSEYVRSK